MAYEDPEVPQDFLLWEATSRDTIDFKRIYVDMTGDLIAGLMLSQIVFWYLPDKYGQSKLRIERDGHRWLAKARYEWWDECRITLEQVKRATKLLVDMDLLITERFKFSGAPTTHMRINWTAFMKRWHEVMASYQKAMEWGENHQSISGKATNPSERKPPIHRSKERQTITETNNTDKPTKKTAKTTPPPTPAPDADTEKAGGGDVEATDVYVFLVEKCGVWKDRARQLLAEKPISLELAAHWWAVLKGDENVRNRSAVLVRHLKTGEQPPEFMDERQRHRFEQYLWEYTADENQEDGDCEVGE